MPSYQTYQIVTVIVGLAGAALTGWALLRTLRSGIAETRFGTIPRDRYPRAYRAVVAFYATGIAILTFAAAFGATLFVTGRS